jgi:hypothetical protein
MKRFRVVIGALALAGLVVVILVVRGGVPRSAAADNSRTVNVYSVKFACGAAVGGSGDAIVERPFVSGNYATSINVHNPNPDTVTFKKKAVITYSFQGIPPVSTEEQPNPPGTALVTATLRPDYGLQIDCFDIITKLLGFTGLAAPQFAEGWVVIITPDSTWLDVHGVYTGYTYSAVATQVPTGFSWQDLPIIPRQVRLP